MEKKNVLKIMKSGKKVKKKGVRSAKISGQVRYGKYKCDTSEQADVGTKKQ